MLFKGFNTNADASSPTADTPVDAISPRVDNVDDATSPTADDTFCVAELLEMRKNCLIGTRGHCLLFVTVLHTLLNC